LYPGGRRAVHVYHQYTIRIQDDRDGFARALADEYGIGSGVPTVRRWWCPSPRSCGIIRLVCALGLPGLRGSEVFQQGVQLSL
jgi:hypothetical protein